MTNHNIVNSGNRRLGIERQNIHETMAHDDRHTFADIALLVAVAAVIYGFDDPLSIFKTIGESLTEQPRV